NEHEPQLHDSSATLSRYKDLPEFLESGHFRTPLPVGAWRCAGAPVTSKGECLFQYPDGSGRRLRHSLRPTPTAAEREHFDDRGPVTGYPRSRRTVVRTEQMYPLSPVTRTLCDRLILHLHQP